MSAASTTKAATTQVYRVYIKATPEAIWQAITDPEWTNRYGYTGYTHYDLRPGGVLKVIPNDEFRKGMEEYGTTCPDVIVDGEVLEVDAPHKLVTTWRMAMEPTCAAEGFSRITYEITPISESACRLTLTHELEPSQVATAAMVAGSMEDESPGAGGGHAWVLSDLKSLLETGVTLAG